jgi:hypothetical protein
MTARRPPIGGGRPNATRVDPSTSRRAASGSGRAVRHDRQQYLPDTAPGVRFREEHRGAH